MIKMDWINILKVSQIVTPTTKISNREEPKEDCCGDAISSIKAIDLDYPFLNLQHILGLRQHFDTDKEHCKAVWDELLDVTINIKESRWWDDAYNTFIDGRLPDFLKHLSALNGIINVWAKCDPKMRDD